MNLKSLRYDTIIKCDLKPYYGYESGFENKDRIIPNCYLLTYDGCSSDLEIDLSGDMCFNSEFETLNRKVIKKVENYSDVQDFINEKKLKSDLEYREGKIFVGGGLDYILNENLEVLGWADELYIIESENIVKENNNLEL